MCIAGTSSVYSTPKQLQQASSNALVFVENKGQITDQYYQPRTDIDFRIGGNGVNLFVGDAAMHYQWVQPTGTKIVAGDTIQEFSTYRMDVQLVGANHNAKVVKEQKQDFYERYYTSPFSGQGAIANSYQRITYKEVYPNIDWVLYVKNNTIEYDFVVRQGGKVSDIKLHYSGTSQLSINKDGSLTATTPFGTVTEAAPFSFQQADGRKVASKFVIENNILSFSTDSYKGTLVIDPTLSWATYYGSTGAETIRNGCVTGDQYGNGYFGGTTNSANNIATTGSYLSTIAGNTDAFLVKFNTTGNRLWATYYGGTAAENTYAITCDNVGNVYLSGYTQSTTGIATTGSYQATLSGSTDAFIVKFDSSGVRQWATYFGGTAAEQCYGITCDNSNNVIITGYTQSTTSIAGATAQQNTYGGTSDAFIAKFSNTGTLKWSTYYGGSLLDYGHDVASDQNNNIYLTGYTRSTNGIATTGAFQAAWTALDDAFLVKFDSSGIRQWGTYYGGTALDRAHSVCTDNSNNVYITGSSASATSIATTGSAQATVGGVSNDAFLAKFDQSGNRVWGTYYGGDAIDDGHFVTFDKTRNYVYLLGRTTSATGIATSGAWKDSLEGTSDAILVKFDTAGTLKWATYFGGEATEIGLGVFCNPFSQVFIGGHTNSTANLATTGSYQSTIGGGNEGFLALFNDCELTAPDTITGNDTVCIGSLNTYTTPPVSGAISYTWTLPSGWSGSSTTNSIDITAGTTTDTIRVAAVFACGVSMEIMKIITVSPLPVITALGNTTVCFGDTVLLTSSAGLTYQWLKNNTIISNATDTSYKAYESGSYSVVVAYDLGCSDTSEAVTITIHPLPTPIIIVNGMELSTSTFSSYQWYHNGNPITGAINQTYTMVATTGAYTVLVTDENGCTAMSAPYTSGTSINPVIGMAAYATIYPNPFNGWLYVDMQKQDLILDIISIDGRVVLSHKGSGKIETNALVDGVYIISIKAPKSSILATEKYIKASISK